MIYEFNDGFFNLEVVPSSEPENIDLFLYSEGSFSLPYILLPKKEAVRLAQALLKMVEEMVE